MADLRQAMAGFQVGFHTQQQVSGHLGVGERPVGVTRDRQPGVFHQGAELVVGGVGVQTPGEQHRAGEFPVPILVDTGQLGVQNWRSKAALWAISGQSPMNSAAWRITRRPAERGGSWRC